MGCTASLPNRSDAQHSEPPCRIPQALTTPNTGYAKLNLISEPAGRGPVLAKSKLNDLDSVPEVCDSKVTLPGSPSPGQKPELPPPFCEEPRPQPLQPSGETQATPAKPNYSENPANSHHPAHLEGLESGFPGLGYVGAPLPQNEDERYQALCGLTALDTATKPVEQFDDITRLLCKIFHVPVAIVSLVGKDRQYFKSVQGLPVSSTGRRESFCAWTLLPQHPEILVVPDALGDIRFAENPLVLNDPFIRFYAGAPLITSSGNRLGSLCIIDRKPRELEAQSCNVLINFAEIVVRELEKEQMRALEKAKLHREASGLQRAFDAFKEGILICNSSTPAMTILFFNDAWAKVTGMEREEVMGKSLWELFDFSRHRTDSIPRAKASAAAKKSFTMELYSRSQWAAPYPQFKATFRPAVSDNLDVNTFPVAIPGLMSTAEEDGVQDDLYFCTIQPSDRRISTSDSSSLSFRVTASLDAKPYQPFEDVQLGALLGQGSYGRVYRGIWNGVDVAVKITQPPSEPVTCDESGDESDFAVAVDADQGLTEYELTAQLAHPNIVATYKHTQIILPYKVLLNNRKIAARETWLVLEFCNQGTLSYAIERGKFDRGFIENGKHDRRPHIPSIKQTARELASAMCYLHGRGMLHGDLNGCNVLLSSTSRDARGFTVKVADFGLARRCTEAPIRTSTYGTVTHMPPELLTEGILSKAADVFAFGAILWELFTGQRPWADMMSVQVIYQTTILGKCLEFPNTTPPGYKQLGQDCLQVCPNARPSFKDILERLRVL